MLDPLVETLGSHSSKVCARSSKPACAGLNRLLYRRIAHLLRVFANFDVISLFLTNLLYCGETFFPYGRLF